MFNKHFRFTLTFLLLALISGAYTVGAQERIDRTVATIKIKDRGIITSIKYSDVMFQLAITPGVMLNPPTSANFNRALEWVINQRLILLLAIEPSPTETEINAEVVRVLANFPSVSEFENRLYVVDFNSLKDENFTRQMAQRAIVEKYLNSRFRSRGGITPEEEENYYCNVFAPEFRRRNPGILMPNLQEHRTQIRQMLTEQKVEIEIKRFLDNAKKRANIVILNDELK